MKKEQNSDNPHKQALKMPVVMQSKFNEFVNNVYCRRESNQHKALKLWKEIKEQIPNDISRLFETEWNHYCMGEFEPDKFGMDIETLKPYFA
jgi:mRNA degradation ribonuclease J1/J2